MPSAVLKLFPLSTILKTLFPALLGYTSPYSRVSHTSNSLILQANALFLPDCFVAGTALFSL